MTLIMLISIFLTILGILLPFFIWGIYNCCKRIEDQLIEMKYILKDWRAETDQNASGNTQ